MVVSATWSQARAEKWQRKGYFAALGRGLKRKSTYSIGVSALGVISGIFCQYWQCGLKKTGAH
jgi:hypothetical protein